MKCRFVVFCLSRLREYSNKLCDCTVCIILKKLVKSKDIIMKIEEILKKSLGYSVVKPTGHRGGGCINQGESYEVDGGKKVFVKQNSDRIAKKMFDGEMASLIAIEETNTIKVPHPIAVLERPKGGHMLVMEHLDLKSCKNQGELGTKLAELHLDNIKKGKNGSPDYVDKFGFDIPTSCGSIPQKNTWCDNWPDYYKSKLQEQIDLIQSNYHDQEIGTHWTKLKQKWPDFFEGIEIKPSLLHGDLWSGNAGQVGNGPTIFDAASFYGHHEYEMGIASMFGGFSSEFYSRYHELLPLQPGHENRKSLYKLFHQLNHWNHFGDGYRNGAIQIMKKLGH